MSKARYTTRMQTTADPSPTSETCPLCERQITVGPSGTEYGHERGESGRRERCPRRPESVDPTGPGNPDPAPNGEKA